MSITIDNFASIDIDNHVDNELKKKIIRFYIYNDTIDKNSSTTVSRNNSKNVLFITEDDNVYAFGDNTRGCLGVKPFAPTSTPQLMNDICKKQVINFYNGTHHMLAQTSNNEIYSWGYNKFGQLGVDPSSTDSLTPQRNKILSGKFIEKMCCGDEHSLALTKTGDVYSWGNNKNGQVGIGRAVKFISRPTNLSLQDAFYGVKIDAISCGTDHSMVLTKNKTVFSWGSNDFGQLGHGDLKERNLPCPLSLKNIIKISCGQKSSMVITENGFLYIFGRSYLDGTNMKQVTPITFTNAITFKDVASHIYFDIFVGLSNDGFCYEFGKFESDTLKRPNKTEEKSLLEYYANEHEITLIVIEIKKINEKVIEEEKPTSNAGPTSNSNTESAAKSSEQTERPSEKKYVNQYTFLYEEIKLLGSGSFGSVFEVKRKSDGVTLAIKKIDLTGRTNHEAKMFLNEMMITNDLDNDYIVKTYEPWYEKNTIYIPMEVCFDTLDTIIREKPKQLFNRKAASDTDCGQIMSITEFFITSELFKEILSGVNYLHKKNHMHRDLKPQNIFISSGENGKFVKIGDFGLAKCLNIQGELIKSHTKMMVGTVKYTAPEVLKNRSDYGLMRDIYSLGVIAEDLYEIVNPPEIVEGSLLSEKYNCIIDIKDEMISQTPKKRPTCDALLSKSDQWCINYDDLKNDNQFNSLKNKIISTNDIQTGFNLYFLNKKLINYLN